MKLIAALLASVFMHHAQAQCSVPAIPFAPSGLMPAGKFAGKCLDISSRRSFRRLTSAEAAKVVPLEVVQRTLDVDYIANVGHNGDFWVGLFPKQKAIQRMTFLVERFPPRWLAAHGFIRVDYDQDSGPLLFSQSDPSKKPIRLESVAFSVEGVPTLGGPGFSPITALSNELGMSHRIVSLDQKIRQVIFEEKNTVRQYPLSIDQAQRDGLWNMLIDELHDPEMQEMYDLFKNNCMNSIFRVLDKFLGHERTLYRRFSSTFPNSTRTALKARTLLQFGTSMESLNNEVQMISKENNKSICPFFLKPANVALIDRDLI